MILSISRVTCGFAVIILILLVVLLVGKRWLFLVDAGKILPCVFWDDVLCSYRKYEGFGLMDRCLKCPHYERFLCEMEDEEEAFFEEVERARERLEKERGGLERG